MPRIRASSDRILAATLLALSAGYLGAAFLIPEPSGGYATVGPRAFPVLIAVALIGCSIWLGVARVPSRDRTIFVNWRLFAFSALIFLGYLLLLPRLGYLISTAAFIALEARLLGSPSWSRNLLIGGIVAASMYAVFNLVLNIPLPAGWIG